MKKLKSYLLIALSVCMMTSCLDKFPQDEIPAGSAITTIAQYLVKAKRLSLRGITSVV